MLVSDCEHPNSKTMFGGWEKNPLGRLRGGVLNRELEGEQPKTFFGIWGGFAKQPTSMESACEELGAARECWWLPKNLEIRPQNWFGTGAAPFNPNTSPAGTTPPPPMLIPQNMGLGF